MASPTTRKERTSDGSTRTTVRSGEAAQQINVLQDDAVNELVPGTGLVPWSAVTTSACHFTPRKTSTHIPTGWSWGFRRTVIHALGPRRLRDDSCRSGGPRSMGHTATARDGTGGHPHGRCSRRHGRESEGPILRYKDATVEPIPSNWAIGLLPHPTLAQGKPASCRGSTKPAALPTSRSSRHSAPFPFGPRTPRGSSFLGGVGALQTSTRTSVIRIDGVPTVQ